MSNRRQMPGLRLKGGIWHIEKRCPHVPAGGSGKARAETRRAEAEQVLIRRLAEIEQQAERTAQGVHTFEEAGLRYIEEIAAKPFAVTAATHLDQLVPVCRGTKPARTSA